MIERQENKPFKIEAEETPEDAIAHMDWDLLKSILEEIAIKSGLRRDKINFLGPESVVQKPSTPNEFTAKYNNEKNLIEIFPQNISLMTKDFKKNAALETARIICHEQIHATTKKPAFTGETKIGYSIFKRAPELPETVFLFGLFNEGVTEKLARQIFNEYVRRAGRHKEDEIRAYESALRNYPEEFPYDTAVTFVDALIIRISEETGVPENSVWQAIVRGMFEGEKFNDEELRSLFSEILWPGFLEELSGATKGDLQKLIRRLRGEKIPESKKEKLKRWLEKIFSRMKST